MVTDTRDIGAQARGPSAVRRLVQAALLALVIVPLGSVAVETAPVAVTCGFGGYYGDFQADVGTGCYGADGDSALFEWFDEADNLLYLVKLQFLGGVSDFFVTFIDNSMDQIDFDAKLPPGEPSPFAGYDCIPMVDPSTSGAPCRDFEVLDPPSQEGNWTGYILTIAWLFDSEAAGFHGGGGRARMLHNRDADLDYDIDMCLAAMQPGSSYVPCDYNGLPVIPEDAYISSGDTDFSSFTAALAPVPEPVSVALFGAGLSAWLYRRRRRA